MTDPRMEDITPLADRWAADEDDEGFLIVVKQPKKSKSPSS